MGLIWLKENGPDMAQRGWTRYGSKKMDLIWLKEDGPDMVQSVLPSFSSTVLDKVDVNFL